MYKVQSKLTSIFCKLVRRRNRVMKLRVRKKSVVIKIFSTVIYHHGNCSDEI